TQEWELVELADFSAKILERVSRFHSSDSPDVTYKINYQHKDGSTPILIDLVSDRELETMAWVRTRAHPMGAISGKLNAKNEVLTAIMQSSRDCKMIDIYS